MYGYILIIIALLFIIYAQYYMKYKNDYQILQVHLEGLNLDTLYEKYPIVIFNKIYDVGELLKTVFAYSYNFEKKVIAPVNTINRNLSKYLIVTTDDDAHIKLINTKYKSNIKSSLAESDLQYVTIRLKQHQVLILPSLWYYHSDRSLNAIGLDDIFSKALYMLL